MSRVAGSIRKRFQTSVLTFVCVVATGWVVPRTVMGREADDLFDGKLAVQEGLVRAVVADIERDVDASSFHTGSSRFDGEWALCSNQMAAMGIVQVVRQHPELRTRYLPTVRLAVEHLLRDQTFHFAHEAWSENPLDSLDGNHGHAYLGYVALAIGSLREIDPSTPYGPLHDRIVNALCRRLEHSSHGAIETYPGEAYPCDIASVVGAIGQHARITHSNRSQLIARMATIYRTRWTDQKSGYLVQSVSPLTGAPTALPRGSGTALSAWFWSFADAPLSRELAASIAHTGHASLAGFGAVREYTPGTIGLGDIDSGPVVLGMSVSATGFALSTARQQNDRARYHEIFRTTELFGVPASHHHSWHFVTGNTLGNAIMLAMLTASLHSMIDRQLLVRCAVMVCAYQALVSLYDRVLSHLHAGVFVTVLVTLAILLLRITLVWVVPGYLVSRLVLRVISR
jgi:hypothetical protein